MSAPFVGPVQLATAAAVIVALALGADHSTAQQELFKSRKVNPDKKGEYTKGIEGPAVDADGNLYVVNFKAQGTIGRLKAGAVKSEKFADLPDGGVASGIRFDSGGRMFVASFKTKRVLVFEKGQTKPAVYFKSEQFNQPNDLAMAKDGTLYASDPLRKKQTKTGRVWRITRNTDGTGKGEIMTADRTMGVTNGIDLSPDERTLYVSESTTGQIWSYRIEGAKLTQMRILATLSEGEVDGLRTDASGRIYVTQNGAGLIRVLNPDGGEANKIKTVGKNPSNLTFGGPDGKTVFVTQVDGGFIESFRVDKPGREPCLQFGGAFC